MQIYSIWWISQIPEPLVCEDVWAGMLTPKHDIKYQPLSVPPLFYFNTVRTKLKCMQSNPPPPKGNFHDHCFPQHWTGCIRRWNEKINFYKRKINSDMLHCQG